MFAQSSPHKIYLTLEEAIARALQKNNQIRESEFGVKKAKWDKRNALTLLFPTLTFSTRYTWIDDSTFALRDFRRYIPLDIPQTVFQESYFTSLDVSLPIFNGSLWNGLSIANATENYAYHMNESTRRNITFQVINNYLNTLKNIAIYNLQEEYLNLSRLNLEKAERLYQAGRYSRAEVLRWKVDLQQQKSIVVNSNSGLRSVMATLTRLLNMNFTENIVVNEQIPQSIVNESERLATLPDEEILNLIQIEDEKLIDVNAALLAAKSNQEVSKHLYRNSYTNYLPNVSLDYSYAWRENNSVALDDYSPKTLMVNFRIPLFTSLQNFTGLKSAYYAYKRDQELFFDQLQNTRLILTETVNNILNLKTQRELSKVNVEYSEHNYRVVEQQKEKGLISNIDFIDAKLNLQQAKLDEISNYYDFISGMVELYYLLGKLSLLIEY
jgi:outer membrane protein TolC